MPRKPRIADPAAIAAAYIGGLSIGAIAAREGCSATAVRTALARTGVAARSPAELVGRLASRWAGGRNAHAEGYVEIYAPDHPRAGKRGYVFEHILVVEKAIGHILPDTVRVLHRNGKRNDNELSNLAIVPVATQRAIARSLRRAKLSFEQRQEAARRYENGESSLAIAPDFGVSPGCLLRILKRQGVRTRTLSEAQFAIRSPATAIELYGRGLSAERVATLLGVSAGAVRNALLANGTKLRPRSFYRRDRSSRWRGGRSVHEAGYILLYRPEHPRSAPNGYVREHILVMEAVLGGPVPDGFDVHHRNGVKDDNRPENLEVLTKAAHARAHSPALTAARWPNRGVA